MWFANFIETALKGSAILAADAAYEYFLRTLTADSKGRQAPRAMMWMAHTRARQGRDGDAESYYLQALATAGEGNAERFTVLWMYSAILRQQGRIEEADALAAEAREVRLDAMVTSSVASDGTKALRVSKRISAPQLMERIEPQYSDDARAAKYQGTVLLYVEITPDGRATNIRIARGGSGLD